MLHESESELDSDEELQEAFAKGLLKPGLNLVSEKIQKTYKNDIVGLNTKLAEISQSSLPWVERLDLISVPAPEAPELTEKLEEEKERVAKQTQNKVAKTTSDNVVLNDFKREMLFYRQAQSAVLEGISKLKDLGIVTKRPDDYFAQMAKSDTHMQKVREHLLQKQKTIEHREKVRHIRLMRKTNKQLQAQVRLQREQEKRELMDKVKQFRKKQRPDLDFLDEKPGKPKTQGNKLTALLKRGETKTKYKNMKYGMGGKKRGSKRNTAESSQGAMSGKPKMKVPFKAKMPFRGKMPRPGKNKRMKLKSRRR